MRQERGLQEWGYPAVGGFSREVIVILSTTPSSPPLGVRRPGYRTMEPSDLTEVEGEAKDRKKIHFAMPTSVPTNLDPRQVEMVSRRGTDWGLKKVI